MPTRDNMAQAPAAPKMGRQSWTLEASVTASQLPRLFHCTCRTGDAMSKVATISACASNAYPQETCHRCSKHTGHTPTSTQMKLLRV